MPANGQIAQLVLQVDANVAIAQRSLQDLARTVNQSATAMNSSLASNDAAVGRTLSSHHQLGLAYNNARIAQTELTAAVTRSIDAYGAGASPLRILSTEMGRLTEAASFLGGGAGSGVLGAIVRFIGGPWGIALLLGGSILAKLVTAHQKTTESVGEMVKKLQEQHDKTLLSAQADDIWGRSIDAVTDKLKKQNEQLRARLALQPVTDQHDLTAAQATVASLGRQLGQAEQTFDANDPRLIKLQTAFAEAVRALYQQNTIAAEAEGAALTDLNKRAEDWAASQTNIVRYLTGIHPELEGQGGAIGEAIAALKKAVSDAAGAGVPFDAVTRQVDVFNNKLAQSPSFIKEYVADLKQLAQQLETTVDAAKNAPKAIEDFKKSLVGAEGTGPNRMGSSAAGFGQFMPSTWESYYKQLFPQQAAGMSSGQIDDMRNVRVVANAVIDKATEDYVALLKKLGADVTAANLYTVHLLGTRDATKLLKAAPGTPTSDFLSPAVLNGNPFLQGTAASARAAIGKRIGDSSGPVSAAAAALQDLQERQRASDAEFLAQSDKLNAEILGAEKDVVGSYAERASVQDQQVDEATKQLKDQIDASAQSKIKAGLDAKTVNAQADILKAKADELANAKKAAIGLAAYVKTLDSQQKAADQNFGQQTEDLKLGDEIATTQAEHRKLQLQILDIVYQQKDYDLRILLAKQRLAGDLEGAAATQAAINHLPTEKSEERSRTLNGTMDPLQAWAKQVPHTAAQINEALQSIEVQGLDNLASSITGVITGTKSLGSAFKDVASSIISDIVQMTVRMLIFRAVTSIFGGAIGGPNLGSDLGVSLPTATPLTSLPGGFRAAGGPVSRGTSYVVGEHGPELFMPSSNGAIMPKVPRINVPANNNSTGPIEVSLKIGFGDAPGFAPYVQEVSGALAQQAVNVSVNHTNQTLRQLARPNLIGGH